MEMKVQERNKKEPKKEQKIQISIGVVMLHRGRDSQDEVKRTQELSCFGLTNTNPQKPKITIALH